MRKRFFIVRNLSAGIPRQRFFAAVIAALRTQGATVTIFDSGDAAQASAAIRSATACHDAIVAAGGDGTFRRMAIAVGEADIPLGLIALGTGNVLARELAINGTATDVANTLLRGKLAKLQGATANGEAFFLMAGVGFDGRVIAQLDQRLKRLFGRASYADTMLRNLHQPVDKLDITIDGTAHSANWLIATKAQHYGGSFILSPTASVFDVGLNVILIQANSRTALFGQLLRLARGKLIANDNPNVRLITAHKIVVAASANADHQVAAQIDGDSFLATPLTIDANGPQRDVIVPG